MRQMVEAKGVRVHTEHAVAKVDPAERLIHFKDGSESPFGVLAYVPPHRAPVVVRDAGRIDESGWGADGSNDAQTNHCGAYAIGQVTGVSFVTCKPLPKASVFAHGEAEIVANNIARAITGGGILRSFDGNGSCFIETDNGRAGFGSGNFFAEPAPQIRLRRPGLLLHLGKVAYEKCWLYRWF